MTSLLSDPDICRSALDALPISVSISTAVRDEDGAIVDFRTEYVNPASVAQSGIPAEEQVGKLASEMLPSFREMELFGQTCRVIETGEPFIQEALVFDEMLPGERRVAGTFEIDARKFGEDGIISVTRDVTERKQAEERLERARGEVHERRFAERQIAEINERIMESLVRASQAMEARDERAAQRAVQETLEQASRLITDLRAVPRGR